MVRRFGLDDGFSIRGDGRRRVFAVVAGVMAMGGWGMMIRMRPNSVGVSTTGRGPVSVNDVAGGMGV